MSSLHFVTLGDSLKHRKLTLNQALVITFQGKKGQLHSKLWTPKFGVHFKKNTQQALK